MSEKVKKILKEISAKNFTGIEEFVSKDIKEGSYDSIFKKQIEIRAEKLRDTLIETTLESAMDVRIAWRDLLSCEEGRDKLTSKLLVKLIILENSKKTLSFVDELCDKLLANEEQK
jgi:hypothetical protein